MPKTYLERLHEQAAELRSKIETVETRAADEDRALTEVELTEVRANDEAYKAVAAQIAERKERQDRENLVAANAPKPPAKDETRGRATTQDRDPGHYRTVDEGGRNSYFGDMYRSQFNRDENAQKRLDEHTRALSVGAGAGDGGGANVPGGGGIVPPKWMTDLYLPLARQNRVLSAQVTPLSLGDDPRALVLPLQTAGTDAVVGAQVEGGAVTGTDAFNTSTETLTPAAIAGKQTVTRQLLDSSTPAVDQLIYADLQSVYDAVIETLVTNALIAAAGGAVTTYATETAFAANAAGTGSVAFNGLIDAETAVWAARFMSANLIAVSPKRYGAFRKLAGQDGRPIVNTQGYTPMNVVGVNNTATPNGLVGEVAGLPLFVTSALAVVPTNAESHLVVRASDAILAESNALQFRFEEVRGPQDVVLGLWRYAGVLVRQAGHGVKRNVVTAAG